MKFPTRKQRNYFDKFKCTVCKGKATHMKFWNNRVYYLCDMCRLKHNVQIGFHSVIIINRKESEEQNG